MKRLSLFLAILLAFGAIASAAVKGEEVEYSANGLKMKGYIAYDDAQKGKRPGILIVHEWWGHNEYVRNRARMLAELGYTAMALDMYGEGKNTTHPDDAGKFYNEVMQNMDVATARFTAAMDVLKKHATVDPSRIAAMGYCFGGSVVLEMARRGLDLRGVASFHGGLETKTPAQPGKVKAAILVCHGGADSFSQPGAVDAFKKEMDNAKADYKVVVYEGAKHSFTNPDADKLAKEGNLPLAYNAEADKKSWAELQEFLKRIFAK